MNDFLALMRTVVAAGWLYLCLLLLVAFGFLVFDRRRKQGAGNEPPKGPGVASRPGVARTPFAHADALSRDRPPREGSFPLHADARRLPLHHAS